MGIFQSLFSVFFQAVFGSLFNTAQGGSFLDLLFASITGLFG